MTRGLRQLWGLETTAAPAAESQQAQQFHQSFIEKIGPANQSLQSAAALAAQSDFSSLAAQRAKLYGAYQATLHRIDPANPSQAQRDIDRVLAATDAFRARASALGAQSVAQSQAWRQRESEYNRVVDQVNELEAAQHPKAPVMRRLVEAIGTQSNDHDFRQSLRTLDQVGPKVNGIYEEHAQSAQARPAPQGSPTAQRAQTAERRATESEPVEMQENFVGGGSVASTAPARTSAPSPPAGGPTETVAGHEAQQTADPHAATQVEQKPPLSQRSPEERAAVQASSDDTRDAAAQSVESRAASDTVQRDSEGASSREAQQSAGPRAPARAEEKPALSQRSPEERAAVQTSPDDAQPAAAQGTEPRAESDTAQRDREGVPQHEAQHTEEPQAAERAGEKPPLEQRSPEERAAAHASSNVTQESVEPSEPSEAGEERPQCEVCPEENSNATPEADVSQGPPAEGDTSRSSSNESAESETTQVDARSERQTPTSGPVPQEEGVGGVEILVTDSATGSAISGVRVEVGGESMVTGSRGAYSLQVSSGVHSYHMTAEGYRPANGTVEVWAGETSGLAVSLDPQMTDQMSDSDTRQPADTPRTQSRSTEGAMASLSFLVSDSATNEPVVGARVRVGDAAVTTGGSGWERLDVPAGYYRVLATADGYRDARSEIEVTEGAEEDLEILLVPQSTEIPSERPESTPAAAPVAGSDETSAGTGAEQAGDESTQSSSPVGRRLTQEERDQMHADIDSIEQELESIRSERNLSWSR